MINALTCTLLLAILLVTGGCNKTHKGGHITVQKICALEVRAMETSATPEDHEWSIDMETCIITMKSEEKDK